jgi:predicted transposase/invertase (TIGR01784 family)
MAYLCKLLPRQLVYLKSRSKSCEEARGRQQTLWEELFNQAKTAKLNPEEMRTHDESLKVYWDNYSVIETAKHEGRQAGREEGREEGREQGRQEGIEIGASQKSLEIAKRLKQKGVAVEVITETTGLTRQQIEKR